MCKIIDWNGEHIDTQAGLRRKVPNRPLPLRNGYPEKARDEHGCLCPIDIESIFERCGVKWKRKPGIPDYVVELADPDTIDYMVETEPNDREEVHEWVREQVERRSD